MYSPILPLTIDTRLQPSEKEVVSPLLKGAEKRLLEPSPKRFTLTEARDPLYWKLYIEATRSYWAPDEVDLSSDVKQWNELLDEHERFFLSRVLAFFASADGIVMENLAEQFIVEVQMPEARLFYGIQIGIEAIHTEMYTILIETYIGKAHERAQLFSALEGIPAIAQKAEWSLKYTNKDKYNFGTRIFAFLIMEGLFFSGSFCAIYWFKKRGLLPGLTFSNELISRDEGMHVRFAALVYSDLETMRMTREEVATMMKEAVEIEKVFVRDSLPVDLIGMNSDLMCQYIEYVADYLLSLVGYEPLYGVLNPFDFMNMISMEGKTNFFEKRVGEYSKSTQTPMDTEYGGDLRLGEELDF
jgi:ribonucleotide reductase beta subunit family protein with ferritin-like domain